MTREELINAIYNDVHICPEYSCNLPDSESDKVDCCLECAEKQLKEYEDKIMEDRYSELLKAMNDANDEALNKHKSQSNNILLQVMKNNPQEFAYVLHREMQISKKNHYVSQCDPEMCPNCVGYTEDGECHMYEWIRDQLASIDIPEIS